jgi:hypothetical protein
VADRRRLERLCYANGYPATFVTRLSMGVNLP